MKTNDSRASPPWWQPHARNLLFTMLGLAIPFAGNEIWKRTYGKEYEENQRRQSEERQMLLSLPGRVAALEKLEATHFTQNEGHWESQKLKNDVVTDALKDLKAQNEMILRMVQGLRFSRANPVGGVPPDSATYYVQRH